MRFHFGFSFSFRQLKKFLIPFILGFLTYFCCPFFSYINVFADENYNSYYNFTYGNESFEDTKFSDSYSMLDILNTFIGYQSSYYNLVISYDNFSSDKLVLFSLVPKSTEFLNFNIYGDYSYGYPSVLSTQRLPDGHDLSLRPGSDSSISSQLDSVRNCLDNNICTNLSSFNIIWFQAFDVPEITSSSSLDIDFSLYSGRKFYYSQIPLIYKKPSSPNSSYFYKSIFFNDVELLDGQSIPTYSDFNFSFSPPNEWTSTNFNDYSNIFVSNVPSSNLSDLRVDFSFNYYDETLVSDISKYSIIYGRVNNETYYSYELLNDCKLLSTSGFGDSEFSLVFNDLSCSSDLSRYDSFFLKFQVFSNSSNSSRFIYNVNLSTNFGYIDSLTSSNNYQIMEHFSDLPSNFNILLSTNQSFRNLYVRSSNQNILVSDYFPSSNSIGHTSSNPISFGKSFSSNSVMVYNYTPSFSGSSTLNLFFNNDVILSYNNNNSYSYFDIDGSIVNSTIFNDYQISSNDSYDLNYYFNQVNDFLSTINDDLVDFHIITQNIYDSMPVFLQTIIIVFVILGLTYFIFKVVRK